MTSAIIDANVLYSALLRDLFMRLAVGRVFQPKWTERIHTEWMENVLKNRPDLSREPLERTRRLMDQWGGDWAVPEYESLISGLSLPDADDRHVPAAAVVCHQKGIWMQHSNDVRRQGRLWKVGQIEGDDY